jgi:divalent metal cation (Fe/Co/Zn/Cd) transporter
MKILLLGTSLVIGLIIFKFAVSLFFKLSNSILDERIKKAEEKLNNEKKQSLKNNSRPD